MFSRRHADRTASIWLQRLKDSGANKRLNLIYLANEVAQQSRARKKDDFLIAFSPIIAEASATAYKGATNEVQQKIRRVIEVWRQRQIFEPAIQEAIEARIDELDKSRSSSKKPLLGGSLFSNSSGPSAPQEIQPLVPLQIAVSKAVASTTGLFATANTEYDKLTDPTKTIPTPPVYAARLSALLKSLANAEGAVSESIKARRALVSGLEKILETNRTALAAEESQHVELVNRKASAEAKKREVEDGIMRGLSAENSPATLQATNSPLGHTNGKAAVLETEPERPDIEELTPPPVENFTPPKQPPPQTHFVPHMPTPPLPVSVPGSDLLSSLSMPPVRHYAGSPGSAGGGGMAKKRKLDDDSDAFGHGEDAMADLDEDVAELLRAESGGHKPLNL